MRAYLAGRGIDLSGEQETKTRKALTYFAAVHARRRRVTAAADEPPGDRPSVTRAGSGARSPGARRRRGPPRRPHPDARAGERRALPALTRRRGHREGPGRVDGRQAPRAGGRPGPRAVDADDEGGLPARVRPTSAPCGPPSAWTPRRSGAAPTRSSSSCPSWCDPSAELLAVEVHKHRRSYMLGGCMVELTDVGTGRTRTRTIAVESEEPARVARTVEGLGLDLRAEHQLSPRAQGARGGGREPLRGHRRRHQLGQAPRSASGRATARGARSPTERWSRGSVKASTTPGCSRRSRWPARSTRSARWPTRRGASGRSTSRPSAPRAFASRPTAREFVGGGAESLRRAGRGHLRRGGEPPRLPGGEVLGRPHRRLARRVRDRRRELPVHVRPRGPRRRAFQRGRGRRAVHGALRPRRHHLPRGRRERARSDRRRPRPARRARHAGHAHRDRRRVHQSRRRGARARDLRRRRSSTAPCSTARRSIARSRSTRRAPPSNGGASSACSPLVPRSSSRARASSGPCWRSSGVHRRPSAIEASGTACWRTGSGRPSLPRLRAAPPLLQGDSARAARRMV